MKKAKIMLSALAVIAIVAAGLAFKAKTLYQSVYCVSTKSGTCLATSGVYKVGGFVLYFTTYRVSTPCSKLNCSSSALLQGE